MKKPLVSIIVRTKNESFGLQNVFMKSLIKITKNYEIIVVDNSSSDKTISIIKKNFKKIKIIKYKSKQFFFQAER